MIWFCSSFNADDVLDADFETRTSDELLDFISKKK